MALLVCVAIYTLADAVNLTFAFALRGAGDTLFVSLLTFAVAWPVMVIPTIVSVYVGASVYWAWGFATAHILAMAICFTWRFRTGKWKSMRVIESAPPDAVAADAPVDVVDRSVHQQLPALNNADRGAAVG